MPGAGAGSLCTLATVRVHRLQRGANASWPGCAPFPVRRVLPYTRPIQTKVLSKMQTRKSSLLVLLLFATVVAADDRSITVLQQDDQITVTFYDFRPETMAWFDQRALQGGGYSWEGLVRASFRVTPPASRYTIEYDSEGDQFFAYVDSGEAAADLKQRIERLTEDEAYRELCMAAASKVGYLE